MERGTVIAAGTHAELLNKVFGTSYKQWMKSVWEYDRNTCVWIIRIDGDKRSGWTNEFVGIGKNEIRETNNDYNANSYSWLTKKPLPYYEYKRRFVFEIITGGYTRKYVFRGVFERDDEKTDQYKERYYRLVDEKLEL